MLEFIYQVELTCFLYPYKKYFQKNILICCFRDSNDEIIGELGQLNKSQIILI